MNPLQMTITDFGCVSFGAARKCRGDAPEAVIVLCLGRILRTVGAVGVGFCRRRFLTFPPHRTRQLLAAPSWEGRRRRSKGRRPADGDARTGYQLSDEPKTSPIPISDLVRDSPPGLRGVLRHGGGGRATDLICGAFEFDGPDTKSFLGVLPEWIRVQKDERRGNEWLDATIRFLTHETHKPELGATTIITSLIDVLFVEAVRTWLKQQPPVAAGWLGALRDPSIGAALGLIHQAPEKRWTVPALSAAVGLSRSPFAARFTALVGQSPMAYVKRWRLQRGASLLRHQALALSSVAERVGYESAAAFSRAFTREFGRSPGRYRHDAAVGEASRRMTKQVADRRRERR